MMRSDKVQGTSQWFSPFNALSAVTWTAQYAMRHVKKYGLTREQLAQIALTDRAHAALNPRALVQQPLTMDEYLSARMISSPLCLFDCDRFTDASRSEEHTSELQSLMRHSYAVFCLKQTKKQTQ